MALMRTFYMCTFFFCANLRVCVIVLLPSHLVPGTWYVCTICLQSEYAPDLYSGIIGCTARQRGKEHTVVGVGCGVWEFAGSALTVS